MLELPARPTSPGARLRWTLADGWTIVRRNLAHLLAEPGALVGELIVPAIMVLLFGYVFGSAIAVPGGDDYRAYLMPGLFAMTAVSGVTATMAEVAADAGRGVMDRFRSMPMARSAVPIGQAGADILTGILSMAIMVGCGVAAGWRPHHGLDQTLAAFGLLILARYAISWGGVLLGLSLREETADRLVPLILPVTMISNAFVPTAHMPTWLRTIADWNPVSALVTACRELFGNAGAAPAHVAWPLAHPVLASVLWSSLLLATLIPLAVRRFRSTRS